MSRARTKGMIRREGESSAAPRCGNELWSERDVRGMLGDRTQPRVYCQKCGEVVYCEFPQYRPEKAKKRLARIHKETGCDGEIEYAAGVTFHIAK